MKTFIKWLETVGSFSIVSCKDRNNPNFQIWGALSDLNCNKKAKKKRLTRHKK
jgi:hypothetical protein